MYHTYPSFLVLAKSLLRHLTKKIALFALGRRSYEGRAPSLTSHHVTATDTPKVVAAVLPSKQIFKQSTANLIISDQHMSKVFLLCNVAAARAQRFENPSSIVNNRGGLDYTGGPRIRQGRHACETKRSRATSPHPLRSILPFSFVDSLVDCLDDVCLPRQGLFPKMPPRQRVPPTHAGGDSTDRMLSRTTVSKRGRKPADNGSRITSKGNISQSWLFESVAAVVEK